MNIGGEPSRFASFNRKQLEEFADKVDKMVHRTDVSIFIVFKCVFGTS